jgi:hypothetical protein
VSLLGRLYTAARQDEAMAVHRPQGGRKTSAWQAPRGLDVAMRMLSALGPVKHSLVDVD